MARLPVSRGEYHSRLASKTLYNAMDAMLCHAMQATESLRRENGLQETGRLMRNQMPNGSIRSRIEGQKEQAGLMAEASKIKSCSGPAQPHSVQLIVSSDSCQPGRRHVILLLPLQNFCPFVSETLLPVPSSHWVSEEPITTDIHRLSHRQEGPVTGVPAHCYSANPNPRLLPTSSLYHLSISLSSCCLLCHFAHTCPPTTP